MGTASEQTSVRSSLREEESKHLRKQTLTFRFVFGSKLFHPSVIPACFRSLDHAVAMALYRAWVRSVAELDRLVLLDLPYQLNRVSACCIGQAPDGGKCLHVPFQYH